MNKINITFNCKFKVVQDRCKINVKLSTVLRIGQLYSNMQILHLFQLFHVTQQRLLQ